jgi:hypothetical protein
MSWPELGLFVVMIAAIAAVARVLRYLKASRRNRASSTKAKSINEKSRDEVENRPG